MLKLLRLVLLSILLREQYFCVFSRSPVFKLDQVREAVVAAQQLHRQLIHAPAGCSAIAACFRTQFLCCFDSGPVFKLDQVRDAVVAAQKAHGGTTVFLSG